MASCIPIDKLWEVFRATINARIVVSGILLGLSLVMLHGQSVNTVQAAGQSLMLNNEPALNAAGNSYIVNSTADTPDADVGNSRLR